MTLVTEPVARERNPREARVLAKARGAFYTPPAIASFLTNWAIRGQDDRVLEPACGDGVFVQAATSRFAELGRRRLAGHLFGVEMEAPEAERARALAADASVLTANFFDLIPPQLPLVHAVIGNPPYIRYHGFTGEQRAKGLARAREQGLALSNLASSWAHFVAHSAAFLEPEGRLALVLPAELMHTDYALPVRDWLLRRFSSVVIVVFDRSAFPAADVDAVLLLASHDDHAGLRTIRVVDTESLVRLELPRAPQELRAYAPRRWSATVDPSVSDIYQDLLALRGTRRLGDLASVDIGVVTGNNRFFILDSAEARRLRIPRSHLVPIVEAASAIRGLSVTASRTKRLLFIEGPPKSRAVRRYVEGGEGIGVAQGYKCRTRSLWYRVPLPRVRPHAFLPYMNHHAPRLLVNRPRSWSTNLLHGVALRRGAPDVRALSAAMLSATTMLSAELEGRAYGGGVLKLETREAERLAIPAFDESIEERLVREFRQFDKLIRAGDVEAASAKVDRILGLDHERYRSAYEVFRRRRLDRKSANGRSRSGVAARSR